MKTIQLDISDKDYEYLKAANKNENVFARDALKEKIARDRSNAIDELLMEGYQATSKEDLQISNEFTQSDLENL